LVLLSLHTLFACFIWYAVESSDDGEAGFAWLLFLTIDWPASRFIFDRGAVPGDRFFEIRLLLLGGLQWALIGMVAGRIASIVLPRASKKER
jgi:hypothetical protein